MKTAADAQALLNEIAAEYRKILEEKLIGVYAHGSLAFGCFSWAVSDIDFLVVVREKLTQAEKEMLIGALLKRRDAAPEKGFEMSVVLQEYLKPFVHPTPFELHFSNAHLRPALDDLPGYCARMNGTDCDLAAHCTVIRAVGQTVVGLEIGEVFGKVPKADYLSSILSDIECAEEDILENPVYVTLNLCRVLAAAREGAILSKREGGQWGLAAPDIEWRGMIEGALAAYEGGDAFEPETAQAREFARHMLQSIIKGIKPTEV